MLHSRGIFRALADGPFLTTHLGVLLLYSEPTATFPRARISAEAYLVPHDEEPS